MVKTLNFRQKGGFAMDTEKVLKLINMNDIELKDVQWLWKPYIPYGKITIFQGDPGEGKTTLIS